MLTKKISKEEMIWISLLAWSSNRKHSTLIRQCRAQTTWIALILSTQMLLIQVFSISKKNRPVIPPSQICYSSKMIMDLKLEKWNPSKKRNHTQSLMQPAPKLTPRREAERHTPRELKNLMILLKMSPNLINKNRPPAASNSNSLQNMTWTRVQWT